MSHRPIIFPAATVYYFWYKCNYFYGIVKDFLKVNDSLLSYFSAR